jgi:predicted DsbA family dithiol-disulfide isomerase
MRSRIFDAYVHEGMDIGRIDRLVELAAGLGLDRSNTRAVLDVDRFDHAVVDRRAQAAANGITAIPVVEVDGERLTGFHDAALLRTFLGT